MLLNIISFYANRFKCQEINLNHTFAAKFIGCKVIKQTRFEGSFIAAQQIVELRLLNNDSPATLPKNNNIFVLRHNILCSDVTSADIKLTYFIAQIFN